MKVLLLRFLFGRGIGRLEEIASKALRHGAGIAGGWLVARGLADEAQATQLVGAVAAGGAVVLSIARTFLAVRFGK